MSYQEIGGSMCFQRQTILNHKDSYNNVNNTELCMNQNKKIFLFYIKSLSK